jgi:predicted ATP-dependent protease
VNVEREARLSGSIHNKGVLIISGFLGDRFAQDRPLSLSVSLTVEQSYGTIDGDSASTAELCAILSSLADVPLRQDIAVTGSVSQRGEIQAVGGVNEKIEGFFKVCSASGLTGTQGVMLPASNVRHLMLDPEVLAAVKANRFHIYAASTVEEALTLLTGVEAGERLPDGAFTPDSVMARAAAKLARFAEKDKGDKDKGDRKNGDG